MDEVSIQVRFIRVLEKPVAAKVAGASGAVGVPDNFAIARSTAIRGLTMPFLVSVTLNPVDLNAFRIVRTLEDGAFCFAIAQAPVTCGVAMEVPFHLPYPVPGTADVIPEPGASRLKNDAEFEYEATALDVSSVAPTLTAVEIHPGEEIALI